MPGNFIVSSYWGDSAPFTLTSSYHNVLSPFTLKQHLVASYSMAIPCCPVHDYEAQTHYHEGDTQSSKTGSLKMKEKHQWNRRLIINSSELQNRLWKSLYYPSWLLSQEYLVCEIFNSSPVSLDWSSWVRPLWALCGYRRQQGRWKWGRGLMWHLKV